MGHMDALTMAAKYVLKQASYVAHTDCVHIIISKILAKTAAKRWRHGSSLFFYNSASMLSAYSPFYSPYHGLHHLATPMHALFAPCPSHSAHHFYKSLTAPYTWSTKIPPQSPQANGPVFELCTPSLHRYPLTLLAVQNPRHQQSPYVDAAPHTCPPAGSQNLYEIYAPRAPEVL